MQKPFLLSIIIIREAIKGNIMSTYNNRRQNGTNVIATLLDKYRTEFHDAENEIRHNEKIYTLPEIKRVWKSEHGQTSTPSMAFFKYLVDNFEAVYEHTEYAGFKKRVGV